MRRPAIVAFRVAFGLAVALSVLASACDRSQPPPEAAAASTATAGGTAASREFTEFMDANRVERIFDAWNEELRRRHEAQLRALDATAPEGCWEKAVASLDMAVERRALAEIVTASIPAAEMAQDVAWLRDSGIVALGPRLDRLKVELGPIQKRLLAESMRAAGRVSGMPPEPPRSTAPADPPAPAVELSDEDRARVHLLMDALGYGAPEVLAGRFLEAMRMTMPGAPDGTWTDAKLLEEMARAAADVESAFTRAWTPQQAESFARSLASPESARHAELMERVTTLVMQRSRPFAENLQREVVRHCGPVDLIGPAPASAPASGPASGSASGSASGPTAGPAAQPGTPTP